MGKQGDAQLSLSITFLVSPLEMANGPPCSGNATLRPRQDLAEPGEVGDEHPRNLPGLLTLDPGRDGSADDALQHAGGLA